MSSGKNPLVWMMALTMPGAAQALGLGDIHVDSALNERLAAEIDIVGATALELADLKAALANRETFARFGADRPAFVASTTFKVTQDSQGRPVLSLRSTESFSEPVVNILVDLNWRSGQLVRQYTLLLDPAGFSVAADARGGGTGYRGSRPMAVAAPVATAAPAVEPATERKTTHVKVGAKATLRGIAWRVGERSESDLQRMMLAIFRANPGAFDGNINRLHRGAVLTIPSHADVAAISKAEAKREIHAQMSAWRKAPTANIAAATAATAATERGSDRSAGGNDRQPPRAPTAAGPRVASPAAAPVVRRSRRIPGHRAAGSPGSVLGKRTERNAGCTDQRARTTVRHATPGCTRSEAGCSRSPHRRERRAARAGQTRLHGTSYGHRRPWRAGGSPGRRVFPAAPCADAERYRSIAQWTALILQPTAFRRCPGPAPPAATAASGRRPTEVATEVAADEVTQPALPALPDEPAGHSEAAHDTTVNLLAKTVNLRVDTTRLDYNFLDLDLTAQHVQMPSVLNETAVVKERRTNLADVLKLAIEREPDRQDLRMKLLELYYSAAATNRTAFLDVVQKLARDRDLLQADQWDKIAFMGRQIAGENPMFAEPDDEDLADCA